MKIQKLIIGIFDDIENRESESGRWQIIGAFIAGMVIAATLAQIFSNAGISQPREMPKPIAPTPSETPYYQETDARPNANPARPVERHMSELVYACLKQEAIISV